MRNVLGTAFVPDVTPGFHQTFPTTRIFLASFGSSFDMLNFLAPEFIRPAGGDNEFRSIRIGYSDISGAQIDCPEEFRCFRNFWQGRGGHQGQFEYSVVTSKSYMNNLLVFDSALEIFSNLDSQRLAV